MEELKSKFKLSDFLITENATPEKEKMWEQSFARVFAESVRIIDNLNELVEEESSPTGREIKIDLTHPDTGRRGELADMIKKQELAEIKAAINKLMDGPPPFPPEKAFKIILHVKGEDVVIGSQTVPKNIEKHVSGIEGIKSIGMNIRNILKKTAENEGSIADTGDMTLVISSPGSF